jgi:ribosome biogenesis GTPase
MHTNEPNCVVGGDWERYAHYLQLLDELRKREDVELRTFGTKRESEMRYFFGSDIRA